MGGVLLISLREFQAIIPAFTRKVVARKKICNTENSERLPHPRKSENRAARNPIHLRNGLRNLV